MPEIRNKPFECLSFIIVGFTGLREIVADCGYFLERKSLVGHFTQGLSAICTDESGPQKKG